jgi:hypothetical protein
MSSLKVNQVRAKLRSMFEVHLDFRAFARGTLGLPPLAHTFANDPTVWGTLT